MDAPEFRIQKRAFKMNAQTARTDRRVFFEGVRGFDNFAGGVQHRFPRRGHDAGDKCGRALTRILQGRNRNGIPLIAIEEKFTGAVGVNVDQAGSDRRPFWERKIGGAIGWKNLGDASVVND